jgi:hypothetical protein
LPRLTPPAMKWLCINPLITCEWLPSCQIVLYLIPHVKKFSHSSFELALQCWFCFDDKSASCLLLSSTRCHAVTEPVIIAANRQLSKLHPIYQLMVPHFRHTIEVNSTARLNLLPARGTIEEIYTPREYVVQMASAYYRDYWTFDSNALPNDLIRR